MDLERANYALEKLAKEKGLSVETVTAEIENAIAQAVQAKGNQSELLKRIPCKGETPTAAEMVAFIAGMISETDRKGEPKAAECRF